MFEEVGLAHAVGKRFESDRAEIERLESEIRRLKWELAQSRAQAAGYGAQLDAMLELHHDTPLRERTDIMWNEPSRRGERKSKLVLIYEKAFDEACRQMKVSDPTKLRVD